MGILTDENGKIIVSADGKIITEPTWNFTACTGSDVLSQCIDPGDHYAEQWSLGPDRIAVGSVLQFPDYGGGGDAGTRCWQVSHDCCPKTSTITSFSPLPAARGTMLYASCSDCPQCYNNSACADTICATISGMFGGEWDTSGSSQPCMFYDAYKLHKVGNGWHGENSWTDELWSGHLTFDVACETLTTDNGIGLPIFGMWRATVQYDETHPDGTTSTIKHFWGKGACPENVVTWYSLDTGAISFSTVCSDGSPRNACRSSFNSCHQSLTVHIAGLDAIMGPVAWATYDGDYPLTENYPGDWTGMGCGNGGNTGFPIYFHLYCVDNDWVIECSLSWLTNGADPCNEGYAYGSWVWAGGGSQCPDAVISLATDPNWDSLLRGVCAPYPTWSLEGYANAYRLDLAHFDSAFYVFLSNCGYVGSDVGWADPATNGTAVSSSAVFHAMTNLKAGSWTGTIKALGPCTPAGKNVGDTITIDGTGWGDGVQTANDGPIMWVTGA